MSDFDHEMAKLVATARDIMSDYEKALDLLVPFVNAYRRTAEPIGDSDLWNEQPRSIAVTMGDCRRASAFLQDVANRKKS